jgi:hypothetical protein
VTLHLDRYLPADTAELVGSGEGSGTENRAILIADPGVPAFPPGRAGRLLPTRRHHRLVPRRGHRPADLDPARKAPPGASMSSGRYGCREAPPPVTPWRSDLWMTPSKHSRDHLAVTMNRAETARARTRSDGPGQRAGTGAAPCGAARPPGTISDTSTSPSPSLVRKAGLRRWPSH